MYTLNTKDKKEGVRNEREKNDTQFYSVINPVGHVTVLRHVTYQLWRSIWNFKTFPIFQQHYTYVMVKLF
jgi:hypothetical protein